MKPIVCFDIESTGTDVVKDRIITLAMSKRKSFADPDDIVIQQGTFNPGIPIPPEATKVHGITNEMVKHCSPFSNSAAGIKSFLDGCDLCGFNLTNFDVPMLWEEFYRAGIEWI
jgi:DNA polymerase-3 subunit epsilon